MLFCRVKIHLMSLVDINQASHIGPDKMETAFLPTLLSLGNLRFF